MYEFFVAIQVPKLPNQNKKEYWCWFQKRVFFCHRWCYFRPSWGTNKSLSFLNFSSLFRPYESQRYISLVSPYHILLLCIGYSHLFIQAVHLFCKTSAVPLTIVYLELNQICLSFFSKQRQFCRAYVVHVNFSFSLRSLSERL